MICLSFETRDKILATLLLSLLHHKKLEEARWKGKEVYNGIKEEEKSKYFVVIFSDTAPDASFKFHVAI